MTVRLIDRITKPRSLAFIAQTAFLIGMLFTFVGAVGYQAPTPAPPPQRSIMLRKATPAEERTYDLQRLSAFMDEVGELS